MREACHALGILKRKMAAPLLAARAAFSLAYGDLM